ncbi:MAG: 30S ribosomal protein S2 [Planctomycetes bacterium]|nr:30S ribosomal protein S2 [Planctomycetota bacterium]MCB9888817.1 30S ribosomal protein S2 [Planctomycetota bacterium]
MPLVTVQELIDAGVHLGHKASRWNPQMKPYIYGKRHNVHIIDLQHTIRGLYQAVHFLRRLAASGAQVMFLGTKRQLRAVVEAEAARCGMPAVTERWIGGTLTNFNTVRERLNRLEELELLEADGSIENYKKKDQATMRREMRKVRRNLEGVRELHGMPGAIIVIDPRREDISIREAARMNVPVICILDTDCDPRKADIAIPGNDDAMSSVQLLLSRLSDAILEGRAGMTEQELAESQRAHSDDARTRQVEGRQPPRERGPRRPRGAPAGGRLGRTSTGRFAEKHSGHAESVSIGADRDDSSEASEAAPPPSGAPAPAAPEAPAEAPSETPPATE